MYRILFVSTLVFLVSLNSEIFAQGDLVITPNRVTFEGKKQKEELNLVNTGKETTTFSISFVQRRMNEDGSFENIEVPDSGQMFADPYLRIYPRKVTLQPGEPQVIMLQCRRKPNMKDGEYRSHLYFRSEKKYTPLGMENPNPDAKLLSVQLIPIYGIGIPVIVRSGELEVTTSLSDLNLETDQSNPTKLTFILHRKGNMSAYGNLKAIFTPQSGKPVVVGEVHGVAVYTNLNQRRMSLRINAPEKTKLKDGKLQLYYTSREDEKYVVYAQAVLLL